MGPGRYRAMTAVMSSMLLGFSPTHTPVIPADSIWNTPEVFPAEIMSKVSLSSSGMASSRKDGSCSCTIFTASSSTVRFRRPRKSILRSPSSSSVVMTYWHTTVPSLEDRGTYSYTGRFVITTPAAWVEAFRGIPSNDLAVSMSRRTRVSPSYRSLSCLERRRASSSVMWGPKGTSLAITSTSA